MTDVATETAARMIRDLYDSCGDTLWVYVNELELDTEEDEEEIKHQIREHLDKAAEYVESAQGILRV